MIQAKKTPIDRAGSQGACNTNRCGKLQSHHITQREHIQHRDSLAVIHGVPRNHDGYPLMPADYNSVDPISRVNITLSQLGIGMHEAERALSRLSRSEDVAAALVASKALSLLTTCQGKFADLMGEQS